MEVLVSPLGAFLAQFLSVPFLRSTGRRRWSRFEDSHFACQQSTGCAGLTSYLYRHTWLYVP
jgi:biotin transporter BioY